MNNAIWIFNNLIVFTWLPHFKDHLTWNGNLTRYLLSLFYSLIILYISSCAVCTCSGESDTFRSPYPARLIPTVVTWKILDRLAVCVSSKRYHWQRILIFPVGLSRISWTCSVCSTSSRAVKVWLHGRPMSRRPGERLATGGFRSQTNKLRM